MSTTACFIERALPRNLAPARFRLRRGARTLLALGALVLAACSTKSDPDQGRYACTAAVDCGKGSECIAQFKGGSLCFKAGACVATEECNGVDDTCDGRVDESFPGQGDACVTGKPGVCAAGTKACTAAAVACAQAVQPKAELCNGLDDDCNGAVDETFDLATNDAHCGACGLACDAGTGCRGGACRETACGDGVDNDVNGRSDCEDPRCLGLVCDPGAVPEWTCGLSPPDAGGADGGLDGGLDGGGADAGAVDAGQPDAGAFDAGLLDAGPPPGCFPPEGNCANGLDDDGDSRSDCADPDCAGHACDGGTCAAFACQ